jgi:hypothetical protein
VSDAENWLLRTRLRAARGRIAAASTPEEAAAAWQEAEAAVSAAGADEEAEVALPVLERDLRF